MKDTSPSEPWGEEQTPRPNSCCEPSWCRSGARRQWVQSRVDRGRVGLGGGRGSWKLGSNVGEGLQRAERRKEARTTGGTIRLEVTPGPRLRCSLQARIKHLSFPRSAAGQPCVIPRVCAHLRGYAGTLGFQKSQCECWWPLQVPSVLSRCGNKKEQTFSVFPTVTRI